MARKTPTPAFKEPPIPGLDTPDSSAHPPGGAGHGEQPKTGLAAVPAPVPGQAGAESGAVDNATANGTVNGTVNATTNGTGNATANGVGQTSVNASGSVNGSVSGSVNGSDDFLNQLAPAVNATVQAEEYPTADLGYAGLKMAGGLLIVLALLIIGLWFMRRIQAKGIFARPGADKLQYVSQIALGQRKNVVVVRFLNKFLVLGVTDSQINLLTEMEAADEQAPDQTGQPDNSDTVDFDQILGKTLRDDTPSGPESSGTGGSGTGGPSR